ncbi:hypothetical protein BO85DRAFT_481828 [Aspergillus piperis CBS 112811]|uniref:Uncharacterized protein n=1 Tax=Aspergillus piperis CBS 112811 TaxID=1448313 RepID=A0A8G1QW24_9EURO|nr:hypothetical protein BO85DRAFT_481828 [Aspergillus piperis CBS 112811]RAH52450.1 hypothetical protein BO85DRAFT_481828 [Aspergillus piperis CBS 112811]
MAVMSGSMPCIRRDPPRLLIMTERDNKRDKESGIREESGGTAVCQGHCSSFFLPDRFDNPEVLPTSASGLVQLHTNHNGTSMHDVTWETVHWPKEERGNGNWAEGGYVRQVEVRQREEAEGNFVNNNNQKGINERTRDFSGSLGSGAYTGGLFTDW